MMTVQRREACQVLAVIVALGSFATAAAAAGTLPSWNEGKTKQSIVDFVAKVTKEGSPDFVPPQDRIATFDNDGTLWAEQPLYAQLFYALDRVKVLAPQHPEWKSTEPFASVLKGDMKGALTGGAPALLAIVGATQEGLTTEEYAQNVSEWLAATKNPKTGKLFTDMAYQPMVELLEYLRSNGFKTFIVSGGGVEFMRVFAEKTYGVPPEQVIGSSGKLKFELRDGKPALVKQPELLYYDDKDAKPIAIQTYIGRRPIAAFGNSDGDLEMLQWTCFTATAHLCLLVHHTDAAREFAYDRKSPIGALDKGLDQAQAEGWTVASMKDDWKTIYLDDSK
jgi:hypothetical protein